MCATVQDFRGNTSVDVLLLYMTTTYIGKGSVGSCVRRQPLLFFFFMIIHTARFIDVI